MTRKAKQSAADTALNIALAEHGLFHDAGGDGFGVRDGIAYYLDSGAYRALLTHAYFIAKGKAIAPAAITAAISTLVSVARYERPLRRAWLRVAHDNGAIILDNIGEAGKAIRIDAGGWSYTSERLPLLRIGKQLPLPEPAATGTGGIDALWNYVNVKPERRVLIAAWLLSTLRPAGPYPILNLVSEHGSGKTTTARLLKSLTDPSAAKDRSAAKTSDDLLIAALHSWVLNIDNASFLSPEISDALCRISTGGSISKRKLYSDTDEVLIEVQRPIILNGIEVLATRPDLADRCIRVECQSIRERKTERDLWAAFHRDAPVILSALLDAAALAIRMRSETRIAEPPRMADFAYWAAAGLPALGFTTEEFLAAYRRNLNEGQDEALDASPVATALVAFMKTREVWIGQPHELLKELARQTPELAAHSRAWPATPRKLTGALQRLAPALRAWGIEVAKADQRESQGTPTIVRRIAPAAATRIAAHAAVPASTTTQGRDAESETRAPIVMQI